MRLPLTAGAVQRHGGGGLNPERVHPAGVHAQPLTRAQSSDGSADRRRHAVAVHFPVGAQVAEEAAPVFVRQPRPDALRDRPQRIERRAPVATGLRGGPQRPQQAAHPARPDARVYGTGRFAVHLRQQAVPRERVDRPAMAAPLQRERGVHHGEAGAEQEDAAVARDAVERAGLPGRAAVERCRVKPAVRDLEVRARQVSQREHRSARLDFAALPQDDAHAALIDGRGDSLAADQLERDAGGSGGVRGGEQRLQVRAVQGARDERVRGSAAPADEVAGIVRERAHARRRQVEHVTGLGGAIREPASQRAAPLDERDTPRPARLPQELHGHQRAARAAPHDRDVHRPHAGER